MNRNVLSHRAKLSHPVCGTLAACVAVLVALSATTANGIPATASMTRETLGLTYPEDKTVSVKFLGTSRLPRSSGEAKVERKKGTTEIEIELDEMKPASLFGGDYNLFEFDSARLTASGREKLAKIAGVLLVTDGYTLDIEGHTDSVGSESYNRELSQKRAEAVRQYMLSQQIAPEIVEAKGFGERRPIASNETPEGRRQNRRVSIVVTDDPARRVSETR